MNYNNDVNYGDKLNDLNYDNNLNYNNDIKKYLYKYVYELRNHKISDNLNRAKQLYKNITKYVNKYTINHPRNVALLEGGDYLENNLSGGALVDADFIKKMTEIATIFNLYKRLDLTKINQNAHDLESKLDDIIREINGLDTTGHNSLTSVALEDRIINSLEHIGADVDKFSNGFKVGTERLKLFLPVNDIGNLRSLPQKSHFDRILVDLTNRIDIMKRTISQNRIVSETDIAGLDAEIVAREREITENIGKMTGLDVLNQYNTEIESGFIYNHISDEIKYVKEVDELVTLLNLVDDRIGNNSVTKDGIKAQYHAYKLGAVKLKDFVDTYNSFAELLEGVPADFIKKCFDGKYTMRMTNNILLNEGDMLSKIQALNEIIKDDQIPYVQPDPTINMIKEMYAPDFNMFKTGQAGIPTTAGRATTSSSATTGSHVVIGRRGAGAASGSFGRSVGSAAPLDRGQSQFGIVPPVVGGSVYTKKQVLQVGGVGIRDLENSVTRLSDKIVEYSDKLNIYKKETKKYNMLQTQTLMHTLFFVLIITNQLFSNKEYVVYKYINRGIITFYLRVIRDISAKIEAGRTSDEILYLKKYHMVTIEKLLSFLEKLASTISSTQKIDITKCTGETANRFLLLNYFKSILDAYNEMYQDKITIYARINDITPEEMSMKKNPILFKEQKMFISDQERLDYITKYPGDLWMINSEFNFNSDKINQSIMHVRSETCKALRDEILAASTGTGAGAGAGTSGMATPVQTHSNIQRTNTYKFTEVFDTVNFPTNGDISKYMTLDTQLANGKGVAIMTYGYSGTGKTFTLFGSKEKQKEGILQSTLDNINGLKSVKFRLYELYGYGLPYPHYWINEGNGLPRINDIEHVIYAYDLFITGGNITYTDCKMIPANGIKTFIDNNATYYNIGGEIVSDVFRNFDKFMDEIEQRRKGFKKDGSPLDTTGENKMRRRIRDTPNNIVSSRSVLIYDFLLEIGDKEVPFLIIDLPGREEITQTYIKPFFENEIVKEIFRDGYSHGSPDVNMSISKGILGMMALNPISIAVFNPNIIFEYVNNVADIATRDKIINDKLPFKYNLKDGKTEEGPYSLLEERINRSIDRVRNGGIGGVSDTIGHRISYFFNYDASKKLVIIKKTGGFGYLDNDSYQYIALLGIHIMNRLLIMKEFKIIYDIYELVVNVEVNSYLEKGIDKIPDTEIINKFNALKSSNFKGEVIHKIKDQDRTRDKLKEILKYDYYLTPFEGIYINENIAGLIKYLGEKMITDETKRLDFISNLKRKIKQDDSLKFQDQQMNARRWMITNTSIKESSITDFFGKSYDELPKSLLVAQGDNPVKIAVDNLELDKEYKKLIGTYKSNGLFNFDKPLITNILDKYVSIINDYKVFYLFGNYPDEELRNLKCSHQFSLLDNTADFIETVVKS